MTKKDYIRFAKIIKDNEVGIINTIDLYINKDKFINDLCIMFKQDNSLFDRQRFINACE